MIEVSSKFICCLARISQPRGDLNHMHFVYNEMHRKTPYYAPPNVNLAGVYIYVFIYFTLTWMHGVRTIPSGMQHRIHTCVYVSVSSIWSLCILKQYNIVKY